MHQNSTQSSTSGLLEAARATQCLPERLLGPGSDSAPDPQKNTSPSSTEPAFWEQAELSFPMSLYYATVNSVLTCSSAKVAGHWKNTSGKAFWAESSYHS